MVRITVCPHFLVELPQKADAKYIERNYIAPLISLVQEAKDSKVVICLSKELVDIYDNGFPWNKMTDSNWKGYLLDWDRSIRSELLLHARISSVPAVSSNNVVCNQLSVNVNRLFEAVLLKLGSVGMPGGMFPEGIISNDNCGNSGIISSFHLVKSKVDFEKVCFPWLRIYNQPLPTGGKFPFVPPSGWNLSSVPIRGNRFSNNGYVDSVGNEWEWDNLHKDHWDVQLSQKKGVYINVNTDGSIR